MLFKYLICQGNLKWRNNMVRFPNVGDKDIFANEVFQPMGGARYC
jgi:hypothetical protein